jgi:hypothetical protein
MIDAIIRQIKTHGVEVRLRSAVSANEELGRISQTVLEVVEDSEEPTVEAFTLCHLFGHLIQFTTRDRYQHLIDPVSETPPVHLSDSFWREFHAYEQEAFGYGASILESAVLPNSALKSQYANFMEIDFEHFRSFITTGTRSNRQEYRAKLQGRYASLPLVAPIAPISIPKVNWAEFSGVEVTIY